MRRAMICVRIDFGAGQFHANPWDPGTNEGEIEWPPSPWRLLRAIVAGWHRSGASEEETFLRVLDALAESPLFDLPVASSGHTRHYVAQESEEGGKPERTLMLDSFVALERGREHESNAFAIWPNADLGAEERQVLERCCSAIRWLGRAESRCEVSLVDGPAGAGPVPRSPRIVRRRRRPRGQALGGGRVTARCRPLARAERTHRRDGEGPPHDAARHILVGVPAATRFRLGLLSRRSNGSCGRTSFRLRSSGSRSAR